MCAMVKTSHVCMDGWMDGCMDVWMDGCMYGCMDGWMYVRTYVRTYVCIWYGQETPQMGIFA